MCIETCNTFCSFVLHVTIVLVIEDNIQNHHRDDLQGLHIIIEYIYIYIYIYIKQTEVLSIDNRNMCLQNKRLKFKLHYTIAATLLHAVWTLNSHVMQWCDQYRACIGSNYTNIHTRKNIISMDTMATMCCESFMRNERCPPWYQRHK